MKIFDKFAIATEQNKDLSADNSPLAFLVPFDNTKAHETQWKTAENWAGRYHNVPIEKRLFDNDFVSGFRLDSVASRYSTDNKLFRIIDPRGFVLEITAANLFDIMENATISKGEIVGKYKWSRDTKVFLTRADHPEYLSEVARIVNPPLRKGDLKPGMCFETVANKHGVTYKYIFLGEYGKVEAESYWPRGSNGYNMKYTLKKNTFLLFATDDKHRNLTSYRDVPKALRLTNEIKSVSRITKPILKDYKCFYFDPKIFSASDFHSVENIEKHFDNRWVRNAVNSEFVIE